MQDLAGVRGAKSTAAKPTGKPAKSPAAGNGHAAQPSDPFAPGTRVKYHDGSSWVTGVVEALEPTAVVKLDDTSVIRTSRDILLAGAQEGIIVAM